ncbi:MAG TPA: cytochrome c [Candidatus Acidoferrum sp.]|nr:cytochrome c [Candidatus Acidoferrum sp.]
MRTMLALLVFALALTCATRAQPLRDDHGTALAALADVQTALVEIVRIEDGNDVGRSAYQGAARRALDAVSAALSRVDRMLDQLATPRWQPAVEGAKVNLLEAQENLKDAIGDREMEDYQTDLTRALANLGLAVGRPSQDGVLGGLSGALANTDLAVPVGATRVDGCTAPARSPAYGVRAGQLVYVALPRAAAATQIPMNLDVRSVTVRGDDVVLYTAHVSACGRQRTRDIAMSAPSVLPLYTVAQAHAGKIVYTRYCLQCHGADLQGTAGPAVAGTEFLKTAKFDGWTLSDVRTTVFQNMPFSNPGSLTPTQYADVMAFLLASSCYPAGPNPFPQADRASFASIRIGPISGERVTNPKIGTCAVK